MHFIDLDSLRQRLPEIKASFNAKEPFRYVAFDNFFPQDKVEEIYQAYPEVAYGEWDGTTYVDQRNKFQKTSFEPGSVMDVVFKEFNSEPFLQWLNELSDLEEPLLGDEDLFGGGLHQSINGAFLNVHVDYNIHPKTKYHRRLNVLVYMNKDWKDEYEGHLELWDLRDGKKKLLEKVSPLLNRCVIFETNEISFHGHPTPLNTPKGVNRKSLATYFYTKNRPDSQIAPDHNTIYVNTQGAEGQVKRFFAGVKAFFERMGGK